MIDCEYEVYTRIANRLKKKFKRINVSGEYVASPPMFPHVSVVQTDSATYRKTRDNSGENHARVEFEINVYSNKDGHRKEECKDIINIINDEMLAMNMRRTSLSPVVNLLDANIYRIVARFSGLVGEDAFYR